MNLGVPAFVLARSVTAWLWVAFCIRFAVMLVIHVTGAEKSLSLTKDSFLYDEVGRQIAEYYRSGSEQVWPSRVTGVIDFAWEHFVGIVYYLVGEQPLFIKMVCVLAGTFVPLVYYRIAQVLTRDEVVSRAVLVAAVFFPTQIYYSGLMVRDSVATLAMGFLFLGIAELATGLQRKWWIPLLVGFVMILGLRSYVASLLAIVVPVGFLLTSILSKGNVRAYRIAASGFLVAGMIGLGVFLSPDIIAELDTQYTDLDYINKIRTKMNTGAGAMFGSGEVTKVGDSVIETVQSILVGIYFFFFSVSPTSLTSIRQFMALPEVLLVVFGTIYGLRGFKYMWRNRRAELLPVLIPTLILTLGYSAATTNGGPLMRWRMQIIGVYLVLAVVGYVVSRRNRAVPGWGLGEVPAWGASQ